MAESSVVKNRTDGTIVITDGTSVTPLSYTVTIEGDGNFSSSSGKSEFSDVMSRGAFAGRRKTNATKVTGGFQVQMRQFTDATEVTIIDVIENTGAWSAAVSTYGTEYEVEGGTKSMTYTAEGTDHGDSADHVLSFTGVVFDWAFAEGDLNTIDVTFEAYARATRTGPS